MFRAVELHTVICGNAINQQKANKKRVLFHVKHEFSTDYLCCIKSNYLNLLFTVVLFLDFNIMIDK